MNRALSLDDPVSQTPCEAAMIDHTKSANTRPSVNPDEENDLLFAAVHDHDYQNDYDYDVDCDFKDLEQPPTNDWSCLAHSFPIRELPAVLSELAAASLHGQADPVAMGSVV